MKAIQWIISALVAVVIIAAAVGGGVYFTRLKSIHSIRKLTDYENYNLYRMDIDYAYDLDHLIDRGITDNQSMINAILAEALPYLPIHMKAPNFGCSAFCTQGTDGHTLMGRNYDFKNDTSAMLVYCTPKDGYASVAFAALDNINANTPDASMAKKLATLTAPFICLDGMNEKGVSIAVLTLDSDPTYQQTGKPMIATTLAIRLVLDRAATTAEAVELLSKYDMFASSGRDYHFYITDASGDGRERYDAIEEILDANAGSIDREIAWQALQAASQAPNPQDVTSNTQWSILYDNTALTAEAVIRRDWNTKTSYDLVSNVAVTDVG